MGHAVESKEKSTMEKVAIGPYLVRPGWVMALGGGGLRGGGEC
jgi:hypothetical protein